MNWTAKFVCGLIGFILFPPFGLLAGVLIGHFIDIYFTPNWHFLHYQSKTQHVFFDSTFLIMGHLAKADGRVTENEIAAAKRIMRHMGLNEERKKQAIKLFTEGKQPGFNLNNQLRLLRQACAERQILLRMFLEIQLQVAYADGHITVAKRQVMQQICTQLGLTHANFSQFEDQFRAGQNYQYQSRQQYQHHYQHSGNHANTTARSLQDAYALLGITSSADHAQAKKAYRKLMSENHPDKLMAKGLPEDMIKIATEKTQRIKQAYEQICAAKGWT